MIMSKICLGMITLSLFVFLSACNSTHNKNTTSTDSTAAPMGQSALSVPSVKNQLPEVPAGAKVFFVNLKNGQTVSSPVEVEMGVSGMSVDSAGVVKAGSGHHHILIDAGDSVAMGTTIPADAHHLHFGNAQTKAALNLSPGKHRLTLQFADGIHRSYGEQMAASITVNVK